jgi:hypothetical protein
MIGSLTRLAERRCYHCRNFVGDARYGHCRLDPPTVSPLLAEHPSAKREAEFVVRNRAGDVDCNYPPVTPTTCWCRRGYARHWRRWLNFPLVERMLSEADAK